MLLIQREYERHGVNMVITFKLFIPLISQTFPYKSVYASVYLTGSSDTSVLSKTMSPSASIFLRRHLVPFPRAIKLIGSDGSSSVCVCGTLQVLCTGHKSNYVTYVPLFFLKKYPCIYIFFSRFSFDMRKTTHMKSCIRIKCVNGSCVIKFTYEIR